METKKLDVFSGCGMDWNEAGVVKGDVHAEMLECVGPCKTDGSL
jgi:hypothetical protein